MEKHFDIDITTRGNGIYLTGAPEALHAPQEVIERLTQQAAKKNNITPSDIDTILRFMNDKESQPSHTGIATYKKELIVPRSPRQAAYIQAIEKSDMVFGIGPAGTGKTYLAVACAVAQFKAGAIDRMIFCRPAVEAGEQLGFLPGDMLDKIDPYLRPIYDALHDMMPSDTIAKKMETGEIEIAPLAFMRGRTLKNAFVILDEAQNTTTMQMKMFLTRMGNNTRMIITGDPSQTDLPKGTTSGLKEAIDILSDIDDIPFIYFQSSDVVRHRLVTKIINAYDKCNKDNPA